MHHWEEQVPWAGVPQDVQSLKKACCSAVRTVGFVFRCLHPVPPLFPIVQEFAAEIVSVVVQYVGCQVLRTTDSPNSSSVSNPRYSRLDGFFVLFGHHGLIISNAITATKCRLSRPPIFFKNEKRQITQTTQHRNTQNFCIGTYLLIA